MVIVKGVDAKAINDSRGENTIEVSIKTNVGKFNASSPNGRSRGKKEVKSYKKSLEGDIKALKAFSDYFTEEVIEKFDDLRRIEDILAGHVGGNSVIAMEFAVLKALAKEEKKQIWQLINLRPKIPRFVGNCVEGGKHSQQERKPDFQEFVILPNKGSAKENYEEMRKIYKEIEREIKQKDNKFKGKKTDEKGWMTSLTSKEVLDILREQETIIGLDIAASSFYKRKKYNYENPPLKREQDEQLSYLGNLIKNYRLFYVEDPFHEEDFEGFARILKKFPGSLIVGDDLTTTNPDRLKKAVEDKSINSIIIKPNQIGSLIKLKQACQLAKENNIKLVFSHRSGETQESILTDLAVGFGADFLKCGIFGSEREAKIKRLIEIEKHFKQS